MKRSETLVNVSDVSDCEPSSPGKINVNKRLSNEQKKDKKKIRLYF